MSRVRSTTVAYVLLALAGLAVHGAILAENLGSNPLSRALVADAEVYWGQAGRIARGELVGEDAFVAAPLYPYVLGALRAAGGGLAAVYALQLALQAGTALLVFRAGALRFDLRTGLVAGALWLSLDDPAYYAGRVLPGTLQAFCLALVLERAAAFTLPKEGARGAASLGVALGVACLAWPAALVALPVAAVWAWVMARRREVGRGPLAGAVVLAAAGLAIAPATLHNLAASGEFVPISAHAGITFYHGNNAQADGTFAAVGVTSDKRVQDREALEQARAALGEDAGWNATSAWFFRRGLDWWQAEPAAALALAGRKLCWTLVGRTYGDVYLPRFEREEGLASRLALAPMPVAWWMPIALVAAAFLLRRAPPAHLPEAGVALLPVVVCTVFWYSPRYRLPGVPAVALLAAWGLLQLFTWRRAPRRALAFAVALVAGGASGVLARAAGLDRPGDYRALHELRMAEAYERLDRLDEAQERYLAAQRLGHPEARVRLANLLRRRDPAQALDALADLARARPADGFAQRSYAVALAQTDRADLALPFFEKAIAIDALDYEAEAGLGGALVQLGRPADALAHFERALEIRADAPDVRFNQGVALSRLGRRADAIDAWRAEVELDPDHDAARGALVNALVADGRVTEAAAEAGAMLERDPEHAGARKILAWIYATSADPAVRDGTRALALIEPLTSAPGGPVDPEALDVHAAALAETGDFAGAARVAARSAEAWRELGEEGEAAAVDARRASYLDGEAHRQ